MFNKKKILGTLAALALSVSCFLAPHNVKADAITGVFSAGSASGVVGDTVTIPVNVGGTKNWSGRVILNFDKEYLQLTNLTSDNLPNFYPNVSLTRFGWGSLKDCTGTANATFKVLKCSSTPIEVKLLATYADDQVQQDDIPGTSGSVTINHSNIKTEEVAPTCTTEGHKKQTCGACNEVISNEVIPALGHDAGAWVTTKEPTCKEAGSKELRCTRDQFVLKTEAIPATGEHKYDWKVTKEATCKEDGEKTGTCSVCGDKKTEVIKATGEHKYDWKVTKEATCKEDGEKTGTCSVCGDKKTEVIKATGEHKYDWKVTKKATCTEKGEKTGICSVCKDKKVEEIKALGHKWKTDKTTDKDGWKVVTEATKEKEGSKERVCSECGEKETAVIEKLADNGKNPGVVNPNKPNSNKPNTNKPSTNKNQGVKTGDETTVALYVGLFVISAGAITAVAMKKKKYHN